MSARAYCGCTSPHLSPMPHDPVLLAEGLADAAGRVAAIADHVHAFGDGIDDADIADLDLLACGISRVACELRVRQHGKDGAPCHD
ncbi:MAG TPA: hypothetical protein VF264_05440 [Rhodanobacteraceae bacterium]